MALGNRSGLHTSSDDRVVSLPARVLDDREFVEQVVLGRPAALRELFDRYAPILTQLMVRMLGPGTDVDDLVQESLLIVIRRADTVRDPSAFRSFVYSVGVRVARNEARKLAIRKKWLPWLKDSLQRTTEAHDIVSSDVLRRVYATLDQLSTDLRVAFVLRFVEERELTEAARATGCSLATFKRRVQRARERFDLLAARDPALAEWLAKGAER